jgi:hypothetical protein
MLDTRRGIGRALALTSLMVLIGGVVAGGWLTSRIIVPGDATATAARITASTGTLRAAYAIFMIEMLAQTIGTVLWYSLLAPVYKPFARLGLGLGLVGAGIKTMARLFLVAPLIVLGSAATGLQVFDARQLESLAMLMIRLNQQGANLALIFLGAGKCFEGLALMRAAWAPRFIAVMTTIAGIIWLVEIYPPLASRLFFPLIIFSMMTLLVTIIWLFRGLPQATATEHT